MLLTAYSRDFAVLAMVHMRSSYVLPKSEFFLLSAVLHSNTEYWSA